MTSPSLLPPTRDLLNGEAMQSNLHGVTYVRSLMAIVAGIACGILGLTSARGFAFYVAAHLLTSLALLMKMNFRVKEYWGNASSTLSFVMDGLSGQAMSFILFWTVSFALVHIY